jgi:hypothetical protein
LNRKEVEEVQEPTRRMEEREKRRAGKKVPKKEKKEAKKEKNKKEKNEKEKEGEFSEYKNLFGGNLVFFGHVTLDRLRKSFADNIHLDLRFGGFSFYGFVWTQFLAVEF